MRSGAFGAGCCALAVRCLLAAPAGAADPVRVAVDWSDVTDEAVTRCGLSRLRAGTIERLVQQGNAVVESVDGTGVSVRVRSSDEALHLRAASGSTVEEAALRFEGCDATFVLEVVDRIAELVTAVASVAPAADSARAASRPELPRPEVAGSVTASAFVDVGGKLTLAGDLQGGGGIGGFAAFPSGLRIGGRSELTGGGSSGVTVLEAVAALTAAHHPRGALLGVRAEVGPLLHLGSSNERSIKEIDGLLSVGVELEAGSFSSQLLVYGRLRRFEHVRNGEGAFDTGHFGLMFRIGAQLSGS